MTDDHEARWEQVHVGGERFPWAIVDGMVQVRLPFRVDREKLTKALQQEGFHVRHDAGETDAQGWGPDYDAEGYYPYWVFPDDGQPEWTIFSFPPEDYDEEPDGATDTADEAGFRPYLGRLSQQELERWLNHLKAARH